MKIERRMILGTDRLGRATRRVVKVRVYEATDPCPQCEGEGRVPYTWGMDGEYNALITCNACGGDGLRDLVWFGDTEIIDDERK